MSNLNSSRRNFISNGLKTVGGAAIGFQSLFGFSRLFAQEATGEEDDLATVINLAATAELFASTHYLAAINSVENGSLDLDDTILNYLKAGFLAEQDHYDLLVSLGASPVVTEFYVPETLFSDVALFAQITEVAETTFTAAYLAATRIFTNMGQAAFAVTAAQISAVEAEHRALVRQIGGSLPNNIPYEKFDLINVSDAVPVLQPFLDGSGDGFVGPVAPPTADDIANIRAQAEMLGYVGDVLPFAAMDMAMASDSDDGMMMRSVMATATNADVNIRQDAGVEFAPIGVLAQGNSAEIDGQKTGTDGFVWWHIVAGGWVRSDVVSASAGASDLPQF